MSEIINILIYSQDKEYKVNYIDTYSVTEIPSVKNMGKYCEISQFEILLINCDNEIDYLDFLNDIVETNNIINMPVVFYYHDKQKYIAVYLSSHTNQITFNKEDITQDFIMKIINNDIENNILQCAEIEYQEFADTVIKAIPNPIFYLDKKERIIGCNHHFEDMLNLRKRDIIGNYYNELMISSTGYHELIETQSSEVSSKISIECSIETSLGNKNLIITKAPLTGLQGSTNGHVCLVSDITYHKQLEEDLKQSEAKFKVIFETMADGLAVLDHDGVILQTNYHFISYFGYESSNEVIGQSIYKFIPEDYKKKILQIWDDFQQNGESIDYAEYRLQKNDGSIVDAEISAAVIRNSENQPEGFVILAHDITERKQAEKQLLISERRNRALLESVPDLMFRMNDEGLHLDKVLGKKISEVFPNNIIKETIPIIQSALTSNQIQIYEYPVLINEKQFYYEARFIVSGDSEVLIILRDVTERKIAEEELRKAKSEAEAANKAKSDFLANMSHEIRTPLHSIHGFIDLLLNSKINKVQEEYLNIISESATSLLGIINDILDFSKIESRKMEIEEISFNPIKDFETVIDLFNVRAQEKNIEVLSFIDPGMQDSIIGDPLRIKQVLTNLVSNAVKFTPEGGSIIISIEQLTYNKEACKIHFVVKDNGIGIPDYKKDIIFEAFRQASSSVTRKYGGSGLGLSISQNLISLMGGELILDSEMGKGSSFHFTLPFKIKNFRDNAESLLFDFGAKIIFVSKTNNLNNRELIIQRYLQFFSSDIRTIQVGEIQDNLADVFVTCYMGIGIELEETKIINQKIYCLISPVDDTTLITGLKSMYTDYFPVYAQKLFNGIISLISGEPVNEGIHPLYHKDTISFRGHVLIAEDNSVNQRLLALMLKDYGITSDIAPNGLIAFDLYKSNHYEIIFMDVNMPVASGIEATSLIREYENEKNLLTIPIVALTARAMKGDKESLFSIGMSDYLSKPIEKKIMIETLEKYLPRHDEHDENKDDVVELPVKREEVKKVNREDKSLISISQIALELGLRDNLVVDIVHEYIKSNKEILPLLKDAISEKNYSDIYNYSHKIKGASLNLRFKTISEYAEIIEISAEEKTEFDYMVLFNKILIEFDKIIEMV